jgi:hypothetical protein
LLDGVSDFVGSDCWMVLVILLGSDSGLGGKRKKKKPIFGRLILFVQLFATCYNDFEGVLLCGSLKIWVFWVNFEWVLFRSSWFSMC